MITEFRVYSRYDIGGLEPDQHEVPHVIVSISTPGSPEAKLVTNPHTLGVLRLWFHDLNDAAMEHVEIRDQYEAECFNRAQARQVLDLVSAHPEAQRLLVHCDAGLSRSPAVAAALSKILLGDDSHFFKRYHPNSRVYRTILEEHHFPSSST